jgi:hypothetical protein
MNEKLSRFKAGKCLQFFVCKMGFVIIQCIFCVTKERANIYSIL